MDGIAPQKLSVPSELISASSCALLLNGSLDGIDGSERETKAVIANLNVLVERYNAFLVSSLSELLPLRVLHRLVATEKRKRPSGFDLAVGSDLETRSRLGELVDSDVHGERLVGDGLA